jgi:hypothetical protein
MNNPEKVQRITIDERLAEDLIRILVADLKAGHKAIEDDSECWGEEVEFLVRPEDYRKKMGIPQAAKKWSWDSLTEGQVFLSGEFQESLTRKSLTGEVEAKFALDWKPKRGFQDIDELSKARVKEKYLAALERRS